MTSFFRICCSLRKSTVVVSYLHDTKFIQSLTKNTTLLLRRYTTITETTCTTAVKTVPSCAPVCSDNSDINLAQTYSNMVTSREINKLLSSVKNEMLPCDVIYALKVLRTLTYIKRENSKHIDSDSRFNKLCNMFEDYSHSMHPSMLVSGLRSLLEIGLPSSNILIDNLELVILSKIADFLMIDLIGCLHLHHKYLCTERQKQVVAALVQEITGRISEISSNAEVFMVLQLLYLFNPVTVNQLQTRIIQLFPNFQVKDLTKVICTLAENNKRNITLLNAAGFYLRHKEEKPDLKETVDVLYALNKLNYVNPNLLSYLTNNRESEIHAEKQHPVIAGLMSACGQLKYRCSAMLEACGIWILDRIDSCSSREFVSYLLTIAALNYIPKNSSIISTVASRLQFEDVSKDIWLDVIWSLAVLNSLDKKLLLHALLQDFYTTLLENANSPYSNKLKLLNLKGLLKLQYPESVFAYDLFIDVPEVQMSEEVKANKQLVLTALNNFIPQGKYMCTHRNSDTGILIDAEFIMGQNGKPLLLSDYGLMSKPSINTKDLPVNAKRIALMIWLYKDFTLNEKTLTGVNALAIRMLSNLGYVIIEVSFGEFVKNKTAVKQVMYLSQAINNALQRNKSDVVHNNE